AWGGGGAARIGTARGGGGSQGRYRSAGPSSAVSVTWPAGRMSPLRSLLPMLPALPSLPSLLVLPVLPVLSFVRASSTRARSRASGTTITVPRPVLAQVAAARAISSGQVNPGSAVHAARAGRFPLTASRNARPAGYLSQGPGSGRGPGPAAARVVFAALAVSVAACRGGIASRSTSASVPA